MLSKKRSAKKGVALADHFRGGKYQPIQVRPVSVAAVTRAKEEDAFPPDPDLPKRPGTVQGMLSTGLGSDSDEGPTGCATPQLEQSGELSDEGPDAQQDPDNVSFVEQRRVEVCVWEARDLPIMDDEPGATTDPYCRIRLGKSVKKTRVQHKILDPVWNEKFILRVPLMAGESLVEDDFLHIDIMDFDMSAHDLAGAYKIRIGPKHDPFPDEGNKEVVPRVSMSGTTTTTTVDGWFTILDSDGEVVYGVGGRRAAAVRLTVHHRHEVRDVSYRPTPAFLAAAAALPGKRTRREVMCMTREMVQRMPAVALLSSKFVTMLCEICELRRWKWRDVVELQNPAASADSLHLVLAGRFSLHAQRTGPHMNMYKVLKSRSFGQSTSFGPKTGWRGPGEAFGEGALVLEEGSSNTSVCVSEEGGLTLRLDRRECERIMEQFRRREAGYSKTLHGSILASDPTDRDITTLSAFLKALPCPIFHKVSDDSVAAIAGSGRLTRVEAGTVVDSTVHGDCVHILCCGTVSVLRDVRSADIRHSLPVPGECIDIMGPGGTFGVRGGGEQLSLLARETADFLSLPRAVLWDALTKDEMYKRMLASPEAMRWKGSSGGGNASRTGRVRRFGSMQMAAKSLSFRKLHKPSKTPLNYVMSVFHRLKSLPGLEGIEQDRLWLLAQTGKLAEFVSGPGKVEGSGAAVMLKGEAELKVFTAAEKPADDDGMKRVVKEGDTVEGGTEILCAGYVAMFTWDQADWAYAAASRTDTPGGIAPLSVGEERQPSCSEAALVEALHGVPILQEVPHKMLLELTQHVRAVTYPDQAVLLCDGEQDCCLYIIQRGNVTVYQDRDVEDANLTAQLTGCDVLFQSSFGPRCVTLKPGESFAQVEFVTGAKSCLTAVCRGTTEVLVLPAECLTPQIHSVMTLSIERSPLPPPGDSHLGSAGELHVLRMLHDLEGHNLRTQLSWKATTFLCGHMQRVVLEPGDQRVVRDNQSANVLAMLSGKLCILPMGASGEAQAQAPPIAILRTGDVFEGHHAKAAEELMGGMEVKLVAVAREESTLFIVDSTNYRTSNRKTLADTVVVVRAFLMRIPLFTSLPLFLFERLARLSRLRKLTRDDRVYSSEDGTEKHVKFLTSGEFKVTKRLAHNTPLAMLGQGCCFGLLDRDRQTEHGKQFAVFASCDATVIEIPAKELHHLLPDDVLEKLHEQLESDAMLADRSAAHDVQPIVTRSHTDTALVNRRSMRQRSASLPDLSQDEEDLQANPPPRLPRDTGPMSQVAYQTGFNSGGMTTFFENVANGKAIPLHEAQSRAPIGKSPEEVLPSLRHKFLADKIALIQRKAHLEALQPVAVEKILTPRAMARRDARKKGLHVLNVFQGKLDTLRKDGQQRAAQQAKALELRRQRLEAQALNNFMAKNKDVHHPESHKKELEEKFEQIEAAMARQREVNEQREIEKAERATLAINRKEMNDQRHLERVQALRKESSKLRRVAVWGMLMALGYRMAAWHSAFAYVRCVREDFAVWVAAAISIQRRFRKHVYGVVRKRKAEAVALIIKNLRIYAIIMRIERKKRGVPIITKFLREYVAQAQGITFHFHRFRNNVKKVQRFWRTASAYLALIDAVVVKSWDQVEHRVRKEEADKQRKEQLRGRGRPPPPMKKLDVAVPALPLVVKMPQIWKLTRHARLEHTELKSKWKLEFQEWVSREEYRVLIQREKSMLQGRGEVERDIMLETWLDDTDPPPRCPILNPVPATEVLDKVIREMYANQAKAAAEAKARSKSRSGSPLGTRKRIGRS